MMKHPLITPLVIGGIALAMPIVLRNAPILIKLPLVPVVATGLVTAATQLQKATLGDIGEALLVAGATWFDLSEPPANYLTAHPTERPSSVSEYLSSRPLGVHDLTTPDFWTAKKALRPKLYIAGQGGGKSKLAAFQFQQQNAAGAIARIADKHFWAPDEDKTVWMPGVPDDQFAQFYLVESAADVHQYLLTLQDETQARLSGQSQDLRPHHFTIDEFDSYWRDWDEVEQAEVQAAIQTINFEGRKVKTAVSLTIKASKKGMNGIDSAIVNGCDLYLMGRALAMTSNQLPTDLDKSLQQERNQVARQLEHPQRALIYQNALTGEAQVVVSRALDSTIQFELTEPETWEHWLHQHQAELDRLVSEGSSLRAISEHFSIARKNDNPFYVNLKTYLQETKTA